MTENTKVTMLDDLDGKPVEDEKVFDPSEEIGLAIEYSTEYNVDPNGHDTRSHHVLPSPMRVRRLPHAEGLPLPQYKTALASGMDISAAIDAPISLNSIGATQMIPTGICIEVPAGFEVQVRPRSGLAAKHGVTVTNAPGTIDADYRGEIKVLLTNLKGKRFTVERGMRIAQLVICPVVQANLIEVDDLSPTERGEGAFGSTGVN